jgi:hypothetical protein
MIEATQALREALQTVFAQLVAGTGQAAPDATFETPKQASHGDLAVTAAMPLARALKKNPREIAAELVQRLQQQPAVQRWVAALEIAGPGFVNLRLAPAAKQAVVAEVLAGGAGYGTSAARQGERVMVEFVSANPTGPQRGARRLHLQPAGQPGPRGAARVLLQRRRRADQHPGHQHAGAAAGPEAGRRGLARSRLQRRLHRRHRRRLRRQEDRQRRRPQHHRQRRRGRHRRPARVRRGLPAA